MKKKVYEAYKGKNPAWVALMQGMVRVSMKALKDYAYSDYLVFERRESAMLNEEFIIGKN